MSEMRKMVTNRLFSIQVIWNTGYTDHSALCFTTNVYSFSDVLHGVHLNQYPCIIRRKSAVQTHCTPAQPHTQKDHLGLYMDICIFHKLISCICNNVLFDYHVYRIHVSITMCCGNPRSTNLMCPLQCTVRIPGLQNLCVCYNVM